MIRIIFIILTIIALFFVQLVNGQDACTTAQTNVATNIVCVNAYSDRTDADTICMGTCRDLFDAIISNCDVTTAGLYSTLISDVCTRCIRAQENLAMNTTCTTVFSTGTDTDAICTGTCRDLFDAIISSCNATTTGEYSTLINNVCTGTTECMTAQANLARNTACTAAFSIGNDTDTICVGTCRDLYDAIISSCNATTTAVYSNLTSTLCGSGDTSVLQQASGIITLLLVAICALIF